MPVHLGHTKQENNDSLGQHPPQNPSSRGVLRESMSYGTIPQNELTPRVTSVMSQLLQEVERLKLELSEAKERVVLLENIAEEDPLVPVLNRRGFERELERTIAHTSRYNTGTSILYIDVDHFKSINDTYGHKAGDIALRHIASFLIENIRQSDIIARIGGDEFALILQHVNKSEARTKAAFLEEKLEKSPCKFEKNLIPLEISIGISEVQPGDDVITLLDRADKEMYSLRSIKRSEK